MFKDTVLSCLECEVEFRFTAEEQEFFHKKGLKNKPKRCHNCRVVAQAIRDGRDTSKITEVNCANCEKLTLVPFKPTGYKPVYCYYCLRSTDKQKIAG